MLVFIVFVFVTIILLGTFLIRLSLLKEPTHCNTCGTRFRHHGYDQILQCPNWEKKDHTGQEEWYRN